jgi:hypothetical protein
MVVNFRAHGISQGVRKLVQTPTLIKKNIRTKLRRKKDEIDKKKRLFDPSNYLA